MIRHLHPTDTPALLQFKQRSGPDEALTLGRAIKGGRKSFPLVKYSSIALSPRAWQSCWVETRRASVQAILRAGTRSGKLAWEVSELFLHRANREVALNVLEQISLPAGASGARRIFLRIPAQSDLFEAARSAGYMPAYTESLYTAESAEDVLDRVGSPPDGTRVNRLEATDHHELFRLFCATEPITVRTLTGQTMEEWSSQVEVPGRNAAHFLVHSADGSALEAHVLRSDVPGGHFLSIRRRIESNNSFNSLLAAGLERASRRRVFTLVRSGNPEYEGAIRKIGFTERASYDVMVKTLAVAARHPVPGLAVAGR